MATHNSRPTRRDVIKVAVATGTLGALAGCTDDDSSTPDSEPDDESTESENQTASSEPDDSASYQLDITVEDADLSELPTSEIGNWDSIRDQDYATVQYQVLEDGESVTPDNATVFYNNQNRDLNGDSYQIPCTELENGENELKLTTTYNGETKTQPVKINKVLPENYRIEPIVDGEPLTDYNTPFEFDIQHLDTEEFFQQRRANQEQQAYSKEEILETMDEAVESGSSITIPSGGLPAIDDKADLLHAVRAFSRLEEPRDMPRQAANEESIIIDRTNTQPQDIYINSLSNPGEGGGGYTTKLAYFEDEWFHISGVGDEVRNINDLDGIEMDEGGLRENHVSTLGEIEEGEMENLQYHRKLAALAGLHSNHVSPQSEPTPANNFSVSEEFGMAGLEMIRGNGDRDEIMRPVEAAAQHVRDTGKRGIMLGTPDEPVLVAADSPDLHRKIRYESDFQDVETVLDEALL